MSEYSFTEELLSYPNKNNAGSLFKDARDYTIQKLKDELNEIKSLNKCDLPERYIINEDATILFWKNGEKTIVKRCKDDEFNLRLGFLTAFFQHYCGMSKNKANKYLGSLNLEKIKKNEKIFIKVIDIGGTYDSYDELVEKCFPKYIKNFIKSGLPIKNKKYLLLGYTKHLVFGTKVALIQDINTSQVFVIKKDSIKEVRTDERD